MRRFLGSALLVCALGALSACNSGSTATYLVGGSVSGLTSGTLTLQINGGETVDISVDGTFTFPTKLAAGATYEITVADTPVGFLATVTNGTGTVAGTVADVAVAVAERTYTVSGAVSGLNGTIVLQNNGGDDVTLVADGPFTFPTALANGATFNVTILSSPPGQNCTVVALEAGSINGADVTGIAVLCLDHYTVGGSVNGLGNHVILRNNGSDEITVDANGPFTFPTPVVDGRSYEVTVVGGSTTQRYTVTNGTGQIAAGNIADVEIGATDKHWWHPAVPADNRSLDGSNADYGRVAIAGTGDCIVVWHQTDGSNSQIFMSSCHAGVWTDPSGPSDNVSPDGQDAWVPDVAMNASGDAVVAWSQTDGTESRIFVSLYRSGTWTHPTALTEGISPAGSDAYFPQVAIADDGDVLVVWMQSDGTDQAIFASSQRGGVWDHPDSLADNLSPSGTSAAFAQVAMDGDGDAVVAWQQNDGTENQVYLSSFDNGSWTNPASLAAHVSPSGGACDVPAVAVNRSGDAVVCWLQHESGNDRVMVSERVDGTWTHPAGFGAAINPSGNWAVLPRAAVATNGDAIVTWYQVDGSDAQIYVSHREGGVWTHPIGLADNISPAGGSAESPFVAMSDNGDAVVAWDQFNPNSSSWSIYMSELRDGTWTHPADLDSSISPTGNDAIRTRVAMNRNGDAVIVWQQDDGSDTAIYASEYR